MIQNICYVQSKVGFNRMTNVMLVHDYDRNATEMNYKLYLFGSLTVIIRLQSLDHLLGAGTYVR